MDVQFLNTMYIIIYLHLLGKKEIILVKVTLYK